MHEPQDDAVGSSEALCYSLCPSGLALITRGCVGVISLTPLECLDGFGSFDGYDECLMGQPKPMFSSVEVAWVSS